MTERGFLYLGVLLLPLSTVGIACAHADATPAATGAATPATQPMDAQEDAPRELYRTWVANNVDTTIGTGDIRLTFRKDGQVKLLAWSDLPFVGQVRNKTTPFTVHGDTLHSDAIHGGTTVHYRLTDQGNLVITYASGRSITFHPATAE